MSRKHASGPKHTPSPIHATAPKRTSNPAHASRHIQATGPKHTPSPIHASGSTHATGPKHAPGRKGPGGLSPILGLGRLRNALVLVACLCAATSAGAQDVTSGVGATVRALDKVTGETTDLALARGQTVGYGRLRIVLGDCRYPVANPNSDAYALLEIRDVGREAPVFRGWMVASSPALNALDHPRYDVWLLRCKSS